MTSTKHLGYRSRCGYVGLIEIAHIYSIEEIRAFSLDIEIPSAKVGKVITKTDLTSGTTELDLLARCRIAVAQTMVGSKINLQQTLADEKTGTTAYAVIHLHGVARNLFAEQIMSRTVVAPMVDIGHSIATILIICCDVTIHLARQRHADGCTGIERTGSIIVPVGDCSRAEVLGHKRGLERTGCDCIIHIGTHHHRIGHIGLDCELLRSANRRRVILRHLHLLLHLCLQGKGRKQ